MKSQLEHQAFHSPWKKPWGLASSNHLLYLAGYRVPSQVVASSQRHTASSQLLFCHSSQFATLPRPSVLMLHAFTLWEGQRMLLALAPKLSGCALQVQHNSRATAISIPSGNPIQSNNSFVSRQAWFCLLSLQVFHVVPTDQARTFVELKAYQSAQPLIETNPTEAKQLLKKVQGHLVLMPLFFLGGENLQPTLATKEGIAPTAIWT